MERRVLKASDGVVTLTERIWPLIKNWEGLRHRQPAHEVIPCCTDLELFKFNAGERERRRAELKLKDQFVLVYSGSIGGWYLTAEMADLFSELLKTRPDAHFLWLTLGPRELIDKLMRERGVRSGQYSVRAASSVDVPSYLSASDAGIAFYKPGFSKLATSPVKVTEYLACGLPFIINAGIGDSDALVKDERAGALVQEFTAEEYARAASSITCLLSDVEETRRRLRETARKLFDVRGVGLARYARLYQRVMTHDS
jgi:glycosyltransferase involved in cell wall biosynthesis